MFLGKIAHLPQFCYKERGLTSLHADILPNKDGPRGEIYDNEVENNVRGLL